MKTTKYNKGEKISDTKAGKTVVWINYMTNFNKTFGGFAAGESEDFMVMNRNYGCKLTRDSRNIWRGRVRKESSFRDNSWNEKSK